MDRNERLAQNESLFREVNERLEELGRRSGTAEDGVDFLCECADVDCMSRLLLSLPEYERLRAHPRHFAVLPGHVAEVDRVVQDRGPYLVVEKVGEAGEVAEQNDPRDHR